jgi:SAM-dependent methyltransferase
VAQVTQTDADNIHVTVVTAPEPIALPQSDHGAARLTVLGRVKWAATMALLRRLGVSTGMQCLDVGCGSGSVSLAMARMVGPTGRVVGFDHNKTVLRWALDAQKRQSVGQATFCTADVHDLDADERYDVVFGRLLLSRVADPLDVVRRMAHAVRPGGLLVVEDEEVSSQFCRPLDVAFTRYSELYGAAIGARGGDPEIGPLLPALLEESGLTDVGLDIEQPAFRRGEGKLLPALTMAHIGHEVVAQGLTDAGTVDVITAALEGLGHDSTSIVGLPRVYQVWGRKGS